MLLKFIWSKRRFIIIASSTVAVISVVVSFLITPVFLSTAIVFPAATGSVSFSEQRNAKSAAMDFGEEEQAEQLVQILQSSRIKDKIVSQFQLLEHYEIDSNDVNKNFKLNQQYNSQISFSRTKFGSIRIDVLDKDAALASEIANKIVDLIDTVKNEMIAERTRPAFEANKRKKEQLERERDFILNQLDSLAGIGVIALDVRSNLFQAYVDASNGADRADLKKKIDVNMQFGAKYDGLEYMRNEKIVKLEDFRVSYEQAESDANVQFNHKFIVERAVKADRKEKPKRSVIVMVSTLMAIFASIFGLLIWDKYKEIKS